MRMRIKLKRWIMALLAGLFCGLAVIQLSPPVCAAGYLQPNREASLSLLYQIRGSGVAGLKVHLYRVAEISETADFTLSGDFAGYPVELGDLQTSSAWEAAAETLAAYAAADGHTALRDASSGAQGEVTFGELQTGLYLVVTDLWRQGRKRIAFDPFLISLPSLNEEDAWVYDVQAFPKGESYQTSGPGGDDKITYQVVKHWEDADQDAHRPKNVTVEIRKDGEWYSTQTLSSENSWAYTWRARDDGSTWWVVERDVPDAYQVQVSRDGTMLTVTNRYTGPGSPGQEPGDKLPQTGQLWWPVPLMAAAGLVLFGAGWAMCIRKKNEEK